jgi:hypothetical protein
MWSLYTLTAARVEQDLQAKTLILGNLANALFVITAFVISANPTPIILPLLLVHL